MTTILVEQNSASDNFTLKSRKPLKVDFTRDLPVNITRQYRPYPYHARPDLAVGQDVTWYVVGNKTTSY